MTEMTETDPHMEKNQAPMGSSAERSASLPPPPQGIRFRAIGLGLSLALLIGAMTPFNNVYKQATPLGGGHFPLAPFFILVWLIVFLLEWEQPMI